MSGRASSKSRSNFFRKYLTFRCVCVGPRVGVVLKGVSWLMQVSLLP